MKPCTAIDGLQEQEEPINTMEGRMCFGDSDVGIEMNQNRSK
jgi:hypothetical protein